MELRPHGGPKHGVGGKGGACLDEVSGLEHASDLAHDDVVLGPAQPIKVNVLDDNLQGHSNVGGGRPFGLTGLQPIQDMLVTHWLEAPCKHPLDRCLSHLLSTAECGAMLAI